MSLNIGSALKRRPPTEKPIKPEVGGWFCRTVIITCAEAERLRSIASPSSKRTHAPQGFFPVQPDQDLDRLTGTPETAGGGDEAPRDLASWEPVVGQLQATPPPEGVRGQARMLHSRAVSWAYGCS